MTTYELIQALKEKRSQYSKTAQANKEAKDYYMQAFYEGKADECTEIIKSLTA